MVKTENNRHTKTGTTRLLVVGIAFVGGLLPLALHWLAYGQADTITPDEAKSLLIAEASDAVLVDIRSRQQYNSAHIDGSQHWSAEDVLSLESPDQVPQQFRNKILLLICEAGVLSNCGARHLNGIGVERVKSVSGGVQQWIGSVAGPKGDVFDRWKTASGGVLEFPFRQSSLYEQLLVVINGFVIKPIHMVLSLVLVLVLWQNKAADLAALRRGIIFLFLGESWCAINYLVFNHTCHIAEYLHSFGMVLCFGLVTYAILEGMDSRILMLSDPDKKCAAMQLCGRCIKYEDVPCGLKLTFFLIIPASIILSFMPLCADYHDTSYNTVICGTFYNYSYPVIRQQFEILYCPIAAIVMLVASLLILFLKKENPLPLAKITFAAGMGPLGFATLRMVFTATYSHNLMWSDFWEEITELLLVVGACIVLWIFRRRLFQMARA